MCRPASDEPASACYSRTCSVPRRGPDTEVRLQLCGHREQLHHLWRYPHCAERCRAAGRGGLALCFSAVSRLLQRSCVRDSTLPSPCFCNICSGTCDSIQMQQRMQCAFGFISRSDPANCGPVRALGTQRRQVARRPLYSMHCLFMTWSTVGGRMFIFGGWFESSNSGRMFFLQDFYCLDPCSVIWSVPTVRLLPPPPAAVPCTSPCNNVYPV